VSFVTIEAIDRLSTKPLLLMLSGAGAGRLPSVPWARFAPTAAIGVKLTPHGALHASSACEIPRVVVAGTASALQRKCFRCPIVHPEIYGQT
jgi:hypothetical protein